MKILQITDVWPSAITRLAKQIVKHNKDLDIKLTTFHPKKPDAKEQDFIRQHWSTADIIDVQYWKSGDKIREMFPDLWNRKKKILTHYNPYNLKEREWDDYSAVCVVNGFQQSVLPSARMMPLSVDLDFFTFNRSHYTTEPIVHMSVNRIEGKKGVLEVAQACNQLGYKFILVGRISDGKYMERVKKAAGKVLDFRPGVSDDRLKASYHEAAVHVCNSVDGFESGTLPVLEAMASGLPVLSRRVGHVPDIYNGENMRINEAANDDIESLKAHLEQMMQDRRYRIKLRVEGEKTVKSRSDKDRAALYRKLYEEIK